MKKLAIIFALAAIPLVAGCDENVNAGDTQIARQQQQATRGLQATVGQPRIVNWTEARLMNRIYELRDQPNLATYTYRSDMDGGLHCLGRSIGYGLPYSAQRSNPQRIVDVGETHYAGDMTLPQSEPNGLFMPDSAAATWVLLVDPKGNPTPVYIEDDVTVSPFPLQNVVEQCK